MKKPAVLFHSSAAGFTMPKVDDIDPAHLREILIYHPEKGEFYWRVRRANNTPIGSRAGTPSRRGYRSLKIKGRSVKEHRIAVAYMTGEWPSSYVDHIDGDTTNNRWENLRVANTSQSVHNRGLFKCSKTGLKGAHWCPRNQKFGSDIALNWKKVWIGYFDTAEEAHSAYCFMACELHGEFANLG